MLKQYARLGWSAWACSFHFSAVSVFESLGPQRGDGIKEEGAGMVTDESDDFSCVLYLVNSQYDTC